MITEILVGGKDLSEEAISQIRAALQPHGIIVYDDPRTDGSSDVGLIFANDFLTTAELAEYAEGAA